MVVFKVEACDGDEDEDADGSGKRVPFVFTLLGELFSC